MKVARTVWTYTKSEWIVRDGDEGDTPDPELDMDALNDAKDAADELDEEDYTEESWQDLQDALNMPETTQDEVDDKTDAINDAIDALVPLPTVEATFTAINEVAGIVSGEVTLTYANLPATADKYIVNHFAGSTPIKELTEATDLFPLPASGKVTIVIYAADGTTEVITFPNVELIVVPLP